MTKKNTERGSLEFYLELNYPVTLYRDPDGGYVAEIKDLPGCMTQGETSEEVLKEIEDARVLWIETAYEHGDQIPLPSTETEYSGKTLLRMPRSLHRKLAEGAEQEGVSLNQYIVSLLSEANTAKNIEPIKEKIDAIYYSIREQKADVAWRDGESVYVAETKQIQEDQLAKDLLEVSSLSSEFSLFYYTFIPYFTDTLLQRQERESSSHNLMKWLTAIPIRDSSVLEFLEQLRHHTTELNQILESKKAVEIQVRELMEKTQLDKKKEAKQ